MGTEVPYMGSKISLISKAEIRYEGILYSIDAEESTVALSQVRSFGTEDRQTEHPVQAREEVFEYIIFRGSDIKDLHVCDTSKLNPPVPTDPAIVESSMSSNNQSSSNQQQPQQLPNNNNNPSATPGQQQQQGNNYIYMSPNSQPYPPSQQQQQHMHQQQQSYPMYNAFGQNYLQFSANQSTHSGSRTPSPNSSHHHHSHHPQQQQHNNHRPQQPSTPGMNHPGYIQSPPGEGRGGGGMRGVHNRGGGGGGGARFPNYSQAVTASNHREEFSRSEGPAPHQHQQQQHYFNKESDHNMPPNRFGGEISQFNHRPVRPQGLSFNNHHANNYDFRFSRGRPPNRGYYGNMGRGGRGGPSRGYMGGGRGSFARGAGRPGSLKFDSEFDFESSNAQFDKLQIEKELKEKLNIGGDDAIIDETSLDPPSSTTTTNKVTGGEMLNGGELDASVVVSSCSTDANCYDKTKSFFDSISCEALDRNGNRSGVFRRPNWKEERKLNFETFGLRGSNTHNHRYRGRSRGGYYNNQGRNGFGGGQDGGGGGYFNRNPVPPFNRPGERSWGNQQRGYRGNKYNNWSNPSGSKYDNNNPYANNNYNNSNNNNSKDNNSVENNAINSK